MPQTENKLDELNDNGYVTIDDLNGGDVTLVGTVHVSKSTRERVIDTISDIEHDIVAIELDSKRLYKLFNKQADFNHTESNFNLGNLIGKYQENIFSENDNLLQPGEADMLPAVEQGINVGSDIALIDMSMSDLKSQIKSNAITDGKIDIELFNKSSEEIIHTIKKLIKHQNEIALEINKNNGLEGYVQRMENEPLSEVKNNLDPIEDIAPEVIDALIDERDKYMAGHLIWLSEQDKDIISVMGRGHLIGVYDYLQNPNKIPDEYIKEPEWYNYNTIDIV